MTVAQECVNVVCLWLQELNDLNKWGLNIFHVAEFSNNRPLSCMMFAIFQVRHRTMDYIIYNVAWLMTLWTASPAGTRSTEDLSDPCGYICHLCDDPGGPLPCQCGLPQQPPRCRCHSVYSCTAIHTGSRCKYLRWSDNDKTLHSKHQTHAHANLLFSFHFSRSGCVHRSRDSSCFICRCHSRCGPSRSVQPIPHKHKWVKTERKMHMWTVEETGDIMSQRTVKKWLLLLIINTTGLICKSLTLERAWGR